MADLVTLAQAKAHLGIAAALTDNDVDVALKVSQASQTVLNYLKFKDGEDPDWTSETVPGDIQAAMLLMLTHLYENRGSDMKADEAVWQAIRRLCERHRDPALA
jgi:hypothetical protein